MIFMVIIKRSGEEVLFDRRKIENAIAKANTSVEEWERASAKDRELVARRVEEIAETAGHPMGVEEIQDAVEEELMKAGLYKLARNYTVYRYKREIARKSNTTDEQIMSLIERNNEEVNRKTQTRTRRLTVYREIIWLVRSVKILQEDFCFLLISCRRMKKG